MNQRLQKVQKRSFFPFPLQWKPRDIPKQKKRQKFHIVLNETPSSSKAKWKWRETLPHLTRACKYLKIDNKLKSKHAAKTFHGLWSLSLYEGLPKATSRSNSSSWAPNLSSPVPFKYSSKSSLAEFRREVLLARRRVFTGVVGATTLKSPSSSSKYWPHLCCSINLCSAAWRLLLPAKSTHTLICSGYTICIGDQNYGQSYKIADDIEFAKYTDTKTKLLERFKLRVPLPPLLSALVLFAVASKSAQRKRPSISHKL